MEVFVSDNYFEHLEHLLAESAKDLLSERPTNIKRIYTLLCSLPVNTDADKKDILKIIKANVGNKEFRSFKESVIFRGLKNGLNKNEFPLDKQSFSNPSAFYFMDGEEDSVEKNAGIVYKTKKYDGSKFYGNCDRNIVVEKGNWNLISNSIPPTNAMLIIDPFLLKPFTKVQNFEKFLEKFTGQCTSIPFHLSIILKTEKIIMGNAQLICTRQRIEEFVSFLNTKKNLLAEVIVMNDMDEYDNRQRDRNFYTNYTAINVGHPFEKDKTTFNQSFLGYEIDPHLIQNNYRIQKRDLLKWKEKIAQLGEFDQAGQRLIWQTKPFTNRLFQNLT